MSARSPTGEVEDVRIEVTIGDGTAAEVAGRHVVSRTSPYAWRRELLGAHDGVDGDAGHERRPAGEEYDRLPDDVGELRDAAGARLSHVPSGVQGHGPMCQAAQFSVTTMFSSR